MNMNFNCVEGSVVEETSDVMMVGSGGFLELLEIYRQPPPPKKKNSLALGLPNLHTKYTKQFMCLG